MDSKKSELFSEENFEMYSAEPIIETDYTMELLMRGFPDPSVWTIAQQFARSYQLDRLKTLAAEPQNR